MHKMYPDGGRKLGQFTSFTLQWNRGRTDTLVWVTRKSPMVYYNTRTITLPIWGGNRLFTVYAYTA